MKNKYLVPFLLLGTLLSACSKDEAIEPEPILSDGVLELKGGTPGQQPQQPNQVWVDLSTGTQSTNDRFSWDLGFWNSAGEFRVILNAAAYAMARPMAKNDLNAVVAADTVGFNLALNFEPTALTPASVAALAWTDNPDGDLTKTALGEIKVNATDNPVFIYRRKAGHPAGAANEWKKIRILRNGEGYTLQHAALNAGTFTTVQITKNTEYNFTFFNFENGTLQVEPKKESWDFCYTQYTGTFPFPGAPAPSIVPYPFFDYVIHNRNNAEVATVTGDVNAYNSFTSSGIPGLNFSKNISVIGTGWRVSIPMMSPVVRTDRFYVIKDPKGLYYKFRFRRLTSTTGERGFPELEFSKL